MRVRKHRSEIENTRRSALRIVAKHRGPVVILTERRELHSDTVASRAAHGAVHVFDPFGQLGGDADHWSPLSSASTRDGSLEVAWAFAQAGLTLSRTVEDDDFWPLLVENYLAPLLYTVAANGQPIETLVSYAYSANLSHVHADLEHLIGSLASAREQRQALQARRALTHFAKQSQRTRTSIIATTQALLRAYRFTRVARSASQPTLNLPRLLTEHSTLYLIGDRKASRLLRPIMTALLDELLREACTSPASGLLFVGVADEKVVAALSSHPAFAHPPTSRHGRLLIVPSPTGDAATTRTSKPVRRLRFRSPITLV